MELSDLVVVGLPFMAIVFGLVEFCKKLGVQGNWLTLASMLIGLLLGIAYQLAQIYPEVGTWFGVVIFGLAVGLAASGLYDFVNVRLPKMR